MDIIELILGVIFGTLIPLLFLRYLPNEKIYDFFYNLGKKADEGASKYIGDKNREAVEDNFSSSLMSLSTGFRDGLDSDDAKLKRLK